VTNDPKLIKSAQIGDFLLKHLVELLIDFFEKRIKAFYSIDPNTSSPNSKIIGDKFQNWSVFW